MVSSIARTRSLYDIYLSHSSETQGFILARDENGKPYYRPGLAPDLSPQQRVDGFSYEHRLPSIDLPASFERYTYGAGFEDAVNDELGFRGYNYTQGVDLSWGSRGYLSPELQTGGTVTSTTPKKFLQADLGLFAINDRYIYEWTGSAWTERYDAGSGGFLNDIFEYTNATDNYVVAGRRGDAFVYSVDGIVWNSSSASGAPAFRSDSVTSGTSSTSLTITAPVSIADNDILIALIGLVSGVSSVSPPAGWNLIATVTGTGTEMYVYWKRAASESGNYTWTWTGTVDHIGYMAAYSGAVTTGSPIEGLGSIANSNAVPAVTTLGANRTVIAGYILSAVSSFTQPTDFTEQQDSTGGGKTVGFASKTEATATTTATLTVTPAAGTTAAAVSFALIPVSPTTAYDVVRFEVRGQTSGEPVIWAIDSAGDMRSATGVPGTWSSADAIQAGEDNRTIAGLNVLDGVLYVWHDRGVTSYDGSAVSTVFSSRTMTLASDAARPYVHSDGKLYGTFSNALIQFDPQEGSFKKMWPRGGQVGNAELNGTITAIDGNEGNLFFVVKNSGGGYYLMKCDPTVEVTVGDVAIMPVHTMYYHGTNAVNAIRVCKASSDALSSTNPHIVIGDGASADYLILPKPGLRPEDDSACRFVTTADRIHVGSNVTYRAQSFPKWLRRGDIEASGLSASKTIALRYQLPGASAVTIATATSNGRTTAAISSEVEFTAVRPVTLWNSNVNTATPVLKGTVLHAVPNPPRDRTFQFAVSINDSEPLEGGEPKQWAAVDQDAFIWDAKGEIVTLTDPFGTTHTLKILDIEPLSFGYDGDGKPQEILVVSGAEI